MPNYANMSIYSKYKILCTEVSALHCSKEQFEILKDRYKEVINSNRRFENVNSLPHLLKILEKRDYLNSNNIQVLIDIASDLRKSSLVQKLKQYEAGSSGSNENVHKRDINCNKKEYSGLSTVPNDPKDKAYKCIAEDIGQKWNDFARALGVPEGYIDDLSLNVKSTPERVYKILAFHEEHSNRFNWLSSLLEALTTARRKDLRIKVQNIYDYS